ncbi:MAG: hypothetical protein GC182_03220 [Rhodopseudomonas sp.]|nr:hypothetical protein [Rhodopseudomonas sp.]
MPNTMTHFNHTVKRYHNQEINLANLRAMLLTGDKAAMFDAAHTTIDQTMGGTKSVVTYTVGAPGKVNWAAHGLVNDTPVLMTTTGALLTGLTAGNWYYIVNAGTNDFELSATAGGASIDFSGTQSGVHTAFANGDNQFFGNGWTLGGELLTSVAAAIVTTNDSLLGCDNISKTPTGGDIGPSYSGVIYDTKTGYVLHFNDFGEVKNAGIGTLFKWNFPNGIMPMNYTPE